MTAQVFIRGRVCHAENLAQRSDAVGFEHLDVDTFADTVCNPVLADVKLVIDEAAVFDPLVMIRDIPFFGDAEAVGKQINGVEKPLEKAAPKSKSTVNRLYDFSIRKTERFQLQAHCDHGIHMDCVRGGIDVVRLESVRSVHFSQP